MFSDYLEEMIANALHDANIEFVHESENKEIQLDFYLPQYDIYIEVKQFHADRIARQMASHDNVIAVQGIKSVKFLLLLLKRIGMNSPKDELKSNK